LLVLLVVVLFLFGSSRLPQLMESVGKSIRSLREGLREPPEMGVTPRESDSQPAPGAGTNQDPPK